MRKLIMILCGLAGMAVSAGCSTLPTQAADDTWIDYRRVAVVESAARHAGLDVVWINYPRKVVSQP